MNVEIGAISWETILKIIGITFTAIGGLYQWRNFRFRSKLKNDLEILKLYGEVETQDENYKAIKTHIDKTIARAYPTAEQNSERLDYLSAKISAILGFLAFLFWLFILLVWGFQWVSVTLLVVSIISIAEFIFQYKSR